jgi:hypothetical protein
MQHLSIERQCEAGFEIPGGTADRAHQRIIVSPHS